MRANVKMHESSLLEAQLLRRLSQAQLPEKWQPSPDYDSLFCWIVVGMLLIASVVVVAVQG